MKQFERILRQVSSARISNCYFWRFRLERLSQRLLPVIECEFGTMVKVLFRRPRGIILDMDGTTIPRTYFAQKLLPFIKDNIKPFLMKHRRDPLVNSLIDELRSELVNDDNAPVIPDSNGSNDEQVFRAVLAGVTYIIHERKKSNVFLSFNVLVTLDGYKSKQLEGE